MKKLRLFAMLLLASVAFTACDKDKDDDGFIRFEDDIAYFVAGESRDLTFVAGDIVKLAPSGYPKGWARPVIDLASRKVNITAPSEVSEDVRDSGVFSFDATTAGGKTLTVSLFAVIGEDCDLSAEVANSYLLNRRNTRYIIDVSRTVEGRNLEVASVEILWQSSPKLVRYTSLDDNLFSFFVGVDDDNTLRDGNALLGGYDRDGNLVWSWHLWIADYDTEAANGTVTLNGCEMMTRNLGALTGGNATTDEVLTSFGLFYQWGRKEPFVGPSSYNAGNGTSATIYNADDKIQPLTYKESSAETGTVEYARRHPLTYITGTEESHYDWMWSGSDELWGDAKTDNDPCPYGWRVAPAAAFANLEIVEPLSGEGIDYATYMNRYGWTLTDGAASSLFMAAGRRVYLDGKFQNVYVNPDSERPEVRNAALYDQPWVGLYWTSGIAGRDAQALSFYFDKAYVEHSAVDGIVSHRRANGMQVRCVRE